MFAFKQTLTRLSQTPTTLKRLPIVQSLRMQSTTVARPLASFKVHSAPVMSQSDLINEKFALNPNVTEPECYFPEQFKQPERPTCLARKLNMRYSSWKLAAVAGLIQGKNVYDAIAIIASVDKKGGPLVDSVLQAAKKNGERQGLQTDRLFVKQSIVGRAISHKKIDIKGRGRHGVIRVPKCSLRIVLEERSEADFYKMIMKGESTPGMAHVHRQMLYQNNADFSQVKALAPITTSAGRRYRRNQFNRLVQKVKQEYASKGHHMRADKIERNLLEKAARDYIQMQDNTKQQALISSAASRQSLFETNYKKQ